MSRLEPGKRTELAMKYTILIMLVPVLVGIPFARSFAQDLGVPEKQFETDVGIALLGFLLGPGLFIILAFVNAVTMILFNIPVMIIAPILLAWIIIDTYITFKKIYNRIFKFLMEKYS